MITVTYRAAHKDDAPHLVDFVSMAGEGLPELAWADMAEPGESLRDVGLRRAASERGSFSYKNATVFEMAGHVAGGLVGYRLPSEPVEIGPDFPPEFVPLQELENLAPGAWYVNILATLPAFRGKGVGTAMLAQAERIAEDCGADSISIIVFSSNPGAERLYRRTGYREVARRKMEVPGWAHSRCEAILLIKPI